MQVESDLGHSADDDDETYVPTVDSEDEDEDDVESYDSSDSEDEDGDETIAPNNDRKSKYCHNCMRFYDSRRMDPLYKLTLHLVSSSDIREIKTPLLQVGFSKVSSREQ